MSGAAADPGAAADQGATAGAAGDRSAGAGAAGRAASAAAARGAGRPAASPPETRIAPTTAQRALVPLVWGLTAGFLALVLPLSAVTVLVVTAVVVAVAWVLAGRSAVVLRPGEIVVRRPVGQVVVPLSDIASVERAKPVLTERAHLVRADGRRLPLPAPQSGPVEALRDPAFDERLTLLRYRVAKGA